MQINITPCRPLYNLYKNTFACIYSLFALFKQFKIWSNIKFAFIFLSSAVRAKKYKHIRNMKKKIKSRMKCKDYLKL